MEVVRARANHGVDAAARGPAKLRQKITLSHLEFLDGVFADVGGNAGAAAAFREVGLVVVVALHHVVVKRGGHTVISQQTKSPAAGNARCQQGQLVDSSPVQRKLLDLLEIDIAGGVGLHCIDGWGVHLHDLLDGTYLKGDQHRGAFAHCYREVLLPKRRKALLLYANCVFTGGQHRYDELAFASTLEFALQAGPDIDNFDLRPFHHSSLRIGDGPVDCSGTELTLAES